MSLKPISLNFCELFDAGNIAGLRELISPAVAASFNGSPTMPRDALLGMVQQFQSAFSQSKHTPIRQIAEADWVVTVFKWTAVHTGEFNGLPATGRPVAIDIVQMDRIVDQRIVEHHGYADVAAMMQQLAAPAA